MDAALNSMTVTEAKSGKLIFEFHSTQGISGMSVDVMGLIDSVFVPENLRGKGLGLSMYKKVGEHLKALGRTLKSGKIIGEAPHRIWQRLEGQHLAKKVGDRWEYTGMSREKFDSLATSQKQIHALSGLGIY